MKTKKIVKTIMCVVCLLLLVCLLAACSKEEHKATPASQAGKASAATLDSYSTDNINVTQNGNTLTVTNTFNAVPVQYAWYVIKGKEAILKQMYTKENSNSFSYEFTEPGSYKIQAFIRTMDKADTRSIAAVNVTVDQNGLKWN